MAHYLIDALNLGWPFSAVREINFVIPSGKPRVQKSSLPKLIFVLKGNCGVSFADGTRFHLENGDILFVSSPCYHEYFVLTPKVDEAMHVFAIFFSNDTPTRTHNRIDCESVDSEIHSLFSLLFERNRHLSAAIDNTIRSLIGIFREEHRSRKFGSLIRQRNLCQSILIETARMITDPPTKKLPAVQQRTQQFLTNEVKEYLRKTMDRQHKLGDIAWRFKISEEHLARVFKRTTGSSVMQYLRSIRVDRAKELLLTSTQDINQIARRAGFSSSNQFCRAFSRAMGYTPTIYRRVHAEGAK